MAEVFATTSWRKREEFRRALNRQDLGRPSPNGDERASASPVAQFSARVAGSPREEVGENGDRIGEVRQATAVDIANLLGAELDTAVTTEGLGQGQTCRTTEKDQKGNSGGAYGWLHDYCRSVETQTGIVADCLSGRQDPVGEPGQGGRLIEAPGRLPLFRDSPTVHPENLLTQLRSAP